MLKKLLKGLGEMFPFFLGIVLVSLGEFAIIVIAVFVGFRIFGDALIFGKGEVLSFMIIIAVAVVLRFTGEILIKGE